MPRQLYRPGTVAYVSKSGGMSNELNNIVARNSDGVYEGVAIGGDRYPGTRFIDHLLRYQDNPTVSVSHPSGYPGEGLSTTQDWARTHGSRSGDTVHRLRMPTNLALKGTQATNCLRGAGRFQ